MQSCERARDPIRDGRVSGEYPYASGYMRALIACSCAIKSGSATFVNLGTSMPVTIVGLQTM